MKDESISRHAARSFICDIYRKIGLTDDQMMTLCKGIKELPPVQPEITLESAISYLYSIGWLQNHDRILTGSAQQECEDAVPRTSVEYICRKNTVSTNPYEHKYHDKFIQFMDDPEISDFGRWQHSNGFNTALVAVSCDLDKVPSVTPKQPGWIPVAERLPTENNSYLVWMPFTPEGHHITVAEWCGSYWNIKTPIMAWMPLPKPWEGAKDGKAD